MTWLKDSVASAAVEHVPAKCPYPKENSTGYCGRTDIRAWGLCRLHHDRIRKHVHSRCESLGIPPLKRDCTRAQDAKRKQVWREAQDQIPDLPPDPPGDADLNEEARFQSELKEFLEEHGHVVMELPPNFFGPGGGAPDLVIHTKKGRMLYRELKTESTGLSPAQRSVHNALSERGIDVATWRPSDMDRGVIRQEVSQ